MNKQIKKHELKKIVIRALQVLAQIKKFWDAIVPGMRARDARLISVCVCIYIYIYTHISPIHIYMIYIRYISPIYIYIYISSVTCAYILRHSLKQTHTSPSATLTRTDVNTSELCVCVYIYIYTHTHTYHTHTHKHISYLAVCDVDAHRCEHLRITPHFTVPVPMPARKVSGSVR